MSMPLEKALLPLPADHEHCGPLRRLALLALGVWMGLCGGTLYAFPAFEVELMEHCSLSAQQLNTVYGFGQLGVGMGIVAGLVYDASGPVATCLYGLVLTLVGNLGLTAALRAPSCGGEGALASLYFALQNGSTAIFQAGLFSNLRATPPESQGVVTGVVAAGYGLSAALASAAFAHAFGSDLAAYLHGTAAVFASTALLGAVAIPRLVRRGGEGGSTAGVCPAASSSDAMAAPSSKGTAEGLTLRSVVQAADFWCFVATFSQLQAVGSGVFMANLGLISNSFGIPRESRLVWVRAVSYCNCAGRLLAGCLMDAGEPRGIPRAAHTIWTAAVLASAAAMLCFAPAETLPSLLLPAALLVGVCYGANWAIMPSFVARRFKNMHVGVCFNIDASIMSCAVLVAATAVGSLYDQAAIDASTAARASPAAPADAGALFCKGALCWRGAFALGLGLSMTGLATAAVLVRQTRLATPFKQGSGATGLAIH